MMSATATVPSICSAQHMQLHACHCTEWQMMISAAQVNAASRREAANALNGECIAAPALITGAEAATAADLPPGQVAASGQCAWQKSSLGEKEKVAGGHNRQDMAVFCTSPLPQLRTVTGTSFGGTCSRTIAHAAQQTALKACRSQSIHVTCCQA